LQIVVGKSGGFFTFTTKSKSFTTNFTTKIYRKQAINMGSIGTAK